MAKIRGLELPAHYDEYLVGIMSQFPDEAMADIGKKFLPGGLARAHAARERVAAMLRSPAEIEIWLLTLLAGAVPGKMCVEKLSAEGLRPFCDAMSRVWPEPNVVVPLLLSPR